MRRVASTLDEAAEFIRQGKPFRLRGSGQPTLYATTEAPGHLGKIPSHKSIGSGAADYWVFSYDTLIAWVTEGEPTVPDVGYSPTTGQHQYLVAHALGVDFCPARGRPTVAIPRNDSLYGRPRRLRRGGMDGARPQSRSIEIPVMDEVHTPGRVSAYEGVSGDAMHYSPSRAGRSRAHP